MARAGAAKAAREPKVARAPRTADTAVTEEVVRAAISRDVSGTVVCSFCSVRDMTEEAAGENLFITNIRSPRGRREARRDCALCRVPVVVGDGAGVSRESQSKRSDIFLS